MLTPQRLNKRNGENHSKANASEFLNKCFMCYILPDKIYSRIKFKYSLNMSLRLPCDFEALSSEFQVNIKDMLFGSLKN